MTFLLAFVGVVISFLVLDAIWIALFVKKYYHRTVGHLLKPSPNKTAAVLFYLLYCAGVVVLAVYPALASGSLAVALHNGAVIGALAYGAFTLTNMAVLKDWTWGLVVTDMVWGVAVSALVAACGYLVAGLQ